MCGMNERNCNTVRVPSAEEIIERGIPCSVIPINADGSFGTATSYNMQNVHVEQYQYEALASALYPAIVEYFESEEGQAEYAKWQAEQAALGLPPLSKSIKRKRRRRR